jgi:glycosyltransferase involved in cell wall biosynthesis
MTLKILHLNFSDNGGSGIVVSRINDCLRTKNYESNILVAEKTTSSNYVLCNQNSFDKFMWSQKKKISRNLKYFFKTKNKNTHSINFFDSNILSQINKLNPDLINIHWIGNELISLKQISKIKIPIIWTLHDMWLYSGAEHYTYNNRYIEGYNNTNKDKDESGFDLNKWVWNRKKKYIHKDIKIITSNNWQEQNVKNSSLLKNNENFKIPYPIDLDFWKPIERTLAKKKLNWEDDKIHLLFGISNYSRKKIKGLDIALDLFHKFNKINDKKYVLNIFGDINKSHINHEQINLLGTINNLSTFKTLYSASDLLLHPSRLESFGLIPLEALACGLPILINKKTGTNDLILSDKMGYCLENEIDSNFDLILSWFNKNCLVNNQNLLHKNIKENFSYSVIGDKYKNLLDKIVN